MSERPATRSAMSPAPLRPVTPHGILVAQLAQARALADEAGVPAQLRTALESAYALASGLDPYLEAMTSPESPGLTALADRTRSADWSNPDADEPHPRGLEAEMLSGHIEGQLLKFLVAMTGARRVLEIGMFTGYSALAIAEALESGATLAACEIDPAAADFARESFAGHPAADAITVHLGPARHTLETLAAAGERFDLVFLDADKAGYGAYLDLLLDANLLADGGTICVDNTLMQGEPWRAEADRSANGRAIAAFNARVADDPRVEQVLIPLRDGITLIRRAP